MSGWRLVAACSLTGILLGTGTALGQAQPSLAEVARQEAERRKSVTKSGKVYTNNDTKTGRPLTTGASPLAKAAETAQERAAGAEQAADEGGGKGAAAKPDGAKAARDALLKRVLDTQERISRNDVEAQRVEKQVDDINERVLASFDTVERDQLIRQREAALEAYRRIQADTVELKQVIRDLEAEANKAPKAPPQ
jgi:hypothetical protein